MVWSDETKINCLGCDGCEWVWKKPGTTLTAQHVKGTVKFGGGSILLWGCMMARGTGYATHINSCMDAELYTRILDDELLQSLEQLINMKFSTSFVMLINGESEEKQFDTAKP